MRLRVPVVLTLAFLVGCNCAATGSPRLDAFPPEGVYEPIATEFCAAVDVAPIASGSGRGSGVVILHNGKKLILTAGHLFVDEAAGKIVDSPAWVSGPCVPRVVAKMIGIDTQKDLAVLQIQDEITLPPYVGVNIAAENPKAGEPLVVIGSPGVNGKTWHQNITTGVVSSVGEAFGVQVVKTDAQIWFGNSGGGFFNSKHELIGIASRLSIRPGLGVVPGGFYGIAPSAMNAFMVDVDKFFLE